MSFEFIDNVPERKRKNTLKLSDLTTYETFIFQSSRSKEVYMKIPCSCKTEQNCYLHLKGHGSRYSAYSDSHVLRVKVLYNFEVI